MNRLHWAIGALMGALVLAHGACAETFAKQHMIVAAEPDAAKAGLRMLRAGGSAVDAAIAAQLVLTLVEPQSSGIGGGAYLLVADGDGRLKAYDGRETAPASAHPNMFLDASGRPRALADVIPGGLSVGVPGTVALLAKAYAAHGRLPWAKLFQPAIRLAEKGFVVPPRLAAELRMVAREALPDMRAVFFHADTPVLAGETLRNPALAATLRKIADGGPRAFYEGDIADEVVDAVTQAPRNPAVMTRADLTAYHAKEREPLCGPYRGYRVCSLPPSTGGGVTLLQILGMLQRFTSDQLKPGTLSAIHLVSQAERLAYADRYRWLGDPDFVAVPVQGLLDHTYLDARARLIDPTRDIGLAQAGRPPTKGRLDFAPASSDTPPGTSHLSVVDNRGEVVSLSTTIEDVFGAKIMAGGFMLNNELTDFAFVPQVNGRPVANAPHGGKRPLSSMTPVIVFAPDGKFYAALGSPGGTRITAYVAKALSALIDGGLPMAQAVAEPHYLNRNGMTELEKGTPLEKLAPRLAGMGHKITIRQLESGLNGIRRSGDGYSGGSDPRREGLALGD